MSTSSARNFGKVLGVTLFLAAFMVGGSVAQLTAAESTTTDANVLEGVVTSTNGPEAGVWVIAETTDLPTKFAKMVVTDEEDEEAKDACSYYEVIERFRGFSFCRIQPRTGRTHQIRVHLASIDCPVLADKTYGGRDCLRLSDVVPDLPPEADEMLMPRQALHASRLRFTHPRLQRFIEAEAPLPPEFQKTLAALRKYRPFKNMSPIPLKV